MFVVAFAAIGGVADGDEFLFGIIHGFSLLIGTLRVKSFGCWMGLGVIAVGLGRRNRTAGKAGKQQGNKYEDKNKFFHDIDLFVLRLSENKIAIK